MFADIYLSQRELFERTHLKSWVMFSGSRYSRSGVHAGIIPLHNSTSLLQNPHGVSRNHVHIPDQWLKASYMCQEMEIFCYPSQLKKLFLASVKRNWWVLTRLKSSLQSKWVQWLSRRRNNVLLRRDVNTTATCTEGCNKTSEKLRFFWLRAESEGSETGKELNRHEFCLTYLWETTLSNVMSKADRKPGLLWL